MRGRIAYVVSIALHLGLAGYVLALPRQAKKRAPTVITMKESRPKVATPPPPKAAEPPPPPPTPTPPAPAPRKAPPRPAPAPAATAPAAAAPAAAAAPDFGLSLGNGGGPGGMAVPQPARGPDKPPEAAPPPRAKVLDAPAAPGASECAEPIVKPKPVQIVQPAYTPDAQEAKIEGKVRVEITISASGEVTDARVLEGLGHGLDEAALAAARASTFTAATRCGQPVGTTFTIGMRFSL